MTSKHTPGPWRDDRADHDAPYQDIHILAGKSRRICSVWIDDAPVHDYNAEQEANARLIVAAPDMLTALKDMVKWYGKRDSADDADDALLPADEQELEVAEAMRAIAKATGGV